MVVQLFYKADFIGHVGFSQVLIEVICYMYEPEGVSENGGVRVRSCPYGTVYVTFLWKCTGPYWQLRRAQHATRVKRLAHMAYTAVLKAATNGEPTTVLQNFVLCQQWRPAQSAGCATELSIDDQGDASYLC